MEKVEREKLLNNVFDYKSLLMGNSNISFILRASGFAMFGNNLFLSLLCSNDILLDIRCSKISQQMRKSFFGASESMEAAIISSSDHKTILNTSKN